mmetsp:Transcript_60409/g.124221  ORF Transcript_60409/g.124221 Transcript_60409/m.124221 type:complete len:335 (-) Transcript_60409:246-1250(-)
MVESSLLPGKTSQHVHTVVKHSVRSKSGLGVVLVVVLARMVERVVNQEVALANTDGIQGDNVVAGLNRILAPNCEGDLHVLSQNVPASAIEIVGGNIGDVAVILQQNLDKTHVDVAEERVVIRAMGGDCEIISLLHLDIDLLGGHIEQSVVQACGLEFGQPNKEVDGVLHADGTRELAAVLTELDLVHVERGRVNAEERIDHTGAGNIAVPHKARSRAASVPREIPFQCMLGHIISGDNRRVRMVDNIPIDILVASTPAGVIQGSLRCEVGLNIVLEINQIAVICKETRDAARRNCSLYPGGRILCVRIVTTREIHGVKGFLDRWCVSLVIIIV